MVNRIIGVIIGVFLAGPIGGLIGYFIGLILDRGMGIRQAGGFSFKNIFQQSYIKSMFILMGHVAKADGNVNTSEITHARNLMHQMRLTEQQKLQAMRWFYQGKNQQFNLDQLLTSLKPYKLGPHLRLLIECLTNMVSVNGKAHPEQQKILRYICNFFDMPCPNFHRRGQSYQQYSHYTSSGAGPGSRPGYSSANNLTSAYQTLGVDRNANESDIRKAYRRLLSRNHPDKLAAKGASESEIKKAAEKTHQIRTAYETVMQSKGINV